MKIFNIRNTNWVIAMSLLALGTVATVSCSKSDSKQEIIDEQGTKLIVKVSGIADEQSSINTKGSITAATTKAPKIVTYPEFDATVSIDNELPASPIAKITQGGNFNLSSNISSSGAKAENMTNLVKYRLFIFKQDGTFVSSESMTAGSAGSIALSPGTYKWAALSYNDENTVDDLTVGGSTDIVLPSGKDVLYANGDVTIANGNSSSINITFKRKYSRLGIELNTMGMFADMVNANVVVSGLSVTKATIQMFDGGLKDFVSDPQTINYASFSNVDPSYGDAKIAYIYTANNAQSEVKVAVSNLTIKLDDSSDRNFTQTANFTFPITPVMGKSYRLLTNLIESPVQIKENGAQWARHNLYYISNNPHNPYRFHHTNKASTDRGTYFSFKALTSSNFGVNSDACSQVYPAGTWKVASSENYSEISGPYTLLLGYLNQLAPSIKGTNFYEYAGLSTNTGAPYESKNLRFYMNGGGISLGLVSGIISLNLGNNGSRIEQWSETAGLDLLGLASLGAVSFEGYNSLIGGGANSVRQTNLLNISAIGIDVLETRFKNVRCVRQ